MKVSVLLLAFNRPDHVVKAMGPICEYKPDRLYLACDGPRADKEGEREIVESTRRDMMKMVNWPCEVKTLFREKNLGCALAVYEAVSWFFEHEEYGIIIEDDVIVGQDFFKLCEELLPMYAENTKIQQIDAFLPVGGLKESNTYSFTKRPMIWGWASWRRAWQDNMDMEMKAWPTFHINKMIDVFGICRSLHMYYIWSNLYQNKSKLDSWGTRWHFAAWVNNLISICPKVNLAKNIGTSYNGTHYHSNEEDPYPDVKIGKISFPLLHPQRVELDREQVRADNYDYVLQRLYGAKKKIKRCLKKISL